MQKQLILLVFFSTLSLACQSAGATGTTGTMATRAIQASTPLTSAEPIWDVNAGAMTGLAQLVDHAVEAEYILLGELHDNPWHHEGQSEILDALLARNRRPAVAFEMFRVDQQALINEHFDRYPEDVTGLAETLRWDDTGWPDWSFYAPLVASAHYAGVPIVAANLSADTLTRMREEGMDALDQGWRQRTGADAPLPRQAKKELAEIIVTAHCGHAPDRLVEVMIDMQRARDAKLAEQMTLPDTDGAVLITGSQHARRDRGVPFYLRHMEPDASVVSIAFIETDEDNGLVVDPALLSSDMPYDYLWFTPRVERDDPCERFRRHLEKRGDPPAGLVE